MRAKMDKIEALVRENQLNLYDVAIMTESGIESRRLQPCNACNDSYSVAKAFTMTAVGLLWDRGLLGMEDHVADILRDKIPSECDPMWERVTVQHALTHRVGFEAGFLDIDQEDVSVYGTQDYLRLVFGHSLRYAPGTVYVYSDAAYYLLSRVVSAISGRRLDNLLMEAVCAPMKFAEIAWSHCPQGYPLGATGLYLSAADMVKLAWPYVNGGEYHGIPILSQAWVKLVLERQYGFIPLGYGDLMGKDGMNGQMLLFSPSRRFAAAWHGYEPKRRDKVMLEWLNGLMD